MQSGTPKPYLLLAGRPLLEWNARRLASIPGHLGTVAAMDEASLTERLPGLWPALEQQRVVGCVRGGETRQGSTRQAYQAALERVTAGFELVLVHDCARPFFPYSGTAMALSCAAASGAAILGTWATDTLKRVDASGKIQSTLPRSEIVLAATPQVFRRAEFDRMMELGLEAGLEGTDEAGLAEAAGIEVQVIPSPSSNMKLTHPEDLLLLPCLESILAEPYPLADSSGGHEHD